MKRFEEIDIIRGLAILLVYLGHSIIYYPIQLAGMYDWCNVLDTSIYSFNLQLFFLISGILFAGSQKSNSIVLNDKIKRLFIPYLVVMALVVCVKHFVLPMAFNKVTGISNILINVFLEGGDRWFIYVLFIMFVFILLIRKYLKNKLIRLIILLLLVIVNCLVHIPSIFLIDKVIYFSFFFIVGFIIKEHYIAITNFLIKYNWLVFALFILLNIVFVRILLPISVIGNYLLALVGFAATFTFANKLTNLNIHFFLIKNSIVYIKYAGKYSLQFYLLSFAYPIIRHLVVNVLYITNPYLIVFIIFIMQLICITIIIEITKRMKFLKIPFGY